MDKMRLIKICLPITAFVFYTFNSFATTPIKAFLTYSTFDNPLKGPFIETNISIFGNTINFVKNAKGKYQGEVDISVAFTQNNEIKNALKYTLESPEVADTNRNYPNFLDQHRYELPNGKYDMEISIADKNKPSEKPFNAKVPVIINFQDNIVTVSDIQVLESYTKSTTPNNLTKSGYDLVPYVSNFYPENINSIKFYAEIYNTKKIFGDGEKVLISYSIQSYQTKSRLNDYSSFSKQVANNVNVLLAEFNIANLPSGNYNITIEVKDKDNKIQAVQILPFQRKNKKGGLAFDDIKSIDVTSTFVSRYKSIDTLSDFIRSLRPISGTAEIQYSENQLKGKNIELMQQYFYNFWKTRDPLQPEVAWKDYHTEVLKVNKEYGTFGRKGYDSDRGRVYLQYGAPDYLSKYDNEPSSYPYEIWQYNQLTDKSKEFTLGYNKQSNKKFVFYNPDLVTNNYTLIQSNAIGEIVDARWELLIYKRQLDMQSSNLDVETIDPSFLTNIDDQYNNPR